MGLAWGRLCYWPKTLLLNAIAITGRFVQGWAVVWAAEWVHLGEGHRAGDLYRCEGLKVLVFQHGGGQLGGAPVSGEGMSKFNVLPQCFVLPFGSQRTS